MSWSLPVGEEFLPDVSVDSLEKHLAREQGARPRLRLLTALHRKQGWSLDEIAAPLHLHRRSVHDILWRFMERGMGAVHDAPKSGRPSYLTVKQQEDLRKRLLAGPQANGFTDGFWTTRMVLDLVKKRYRRGYTREHMTRLLHKLGFSSQKPRPESPRKASKEEIERFKKKHGAWLVTG